MATLMYIRGPSMARSFSIADARDQLPALVHEAEEGVPVELTRRGKPVAVLISVTEYARLTSGRADFSAALARFRARHAVGELDLGEVLEGTRDGAPGRDFRWD